MDYINEEILKADRLIIGTPVHMAYATALMMTFLERICWTFAKPEKSYILVKGCPTPRSDKKRKAVIIAVSGMIPSKYKKLCNEATPQIKGVIKDSLNAETVGKLYAGDVWHTGVEIYMDDAFKLGKKTYIVLQKSFYRVNLIIRYTSYNMSLALCICLDRLFLNFSL